ncbi:uncharacterized protein [Parasteatoda tepidariorum]|uniref:uncharacterized protein isoform X2 n=1 Tax=Parasteatoda tepidariorum TaxID=114398 RepID=UPI00077FC2C3|nr:uncharacterized protein LOC107436706 isoform X4 [Parasteatoda tepidariorum]
MKKAMASSRSRFYVDTPFDNELPSQRHSMYVSHSEVDASIKKQDLSSASSSATLPSAAGSVDRLTGLGNEKKTPRFFTLKPKTSFSLRPFFSSSSIPSLSPSKRRKKESKIAQRQDSYVQTDDNQRFYDEVGVQTQNASTVDVPVQTCSNEWDDACNYKKPLVTRPTFSLSPYGSYSSRWSPSSVASKPPGLVSDENKSSKNSFVAPLDSSKLLKYATPFATADSSPKPTSAKLLKEEKSLTDGSCLQHSASQLPLSVNETSALVHSADPKSVPSNSVDTIDESQKSGSDLKNSIESNPKISHNREKDAVKILKSNSETKDNIIRSSNSPTSVLKIDRTDSPKPSKAKTVHFDLNDSKFDSPVPKTYSPIPKTYSSATTTELSIPRNIDKEFEALLRNLDILPEEPDNVDLKVSPDSVPQTPPKVNYVSPDLKTALDALKQDFLAPIPENDVNSDDNPERITDEYSTNVNDAPSSVNKNLNEEHLKINIEAETADGGSQNKQTPTLVQDESGNKLLDLGEKSYIPTSSASAKLDVEITAESENVYDKENTGEPVKTVQLPTLPSFFENSSETTESEIIDPRLSVVSSSFEDPNESMLSRSSSRSSMRSNPRSDFESCLERASKFDSCENLDQLEEEIIRSLYSEDVMDDLGNTQPQFDNSGVTAAPNIRRVILDRLLSGESVDEIMPSSPNTVGGLEEHFDFNDARKKVKQSKKYTATLSKFEEPEIENYTELPTPRHQNYINATLNMNNTNNYSSTDTVLDPRDKRYESNDGFRSHSPLNSKIYKADSNGFSPDERMKSPSLVNGKNDNYHNGSAEPSNTIITHEPPPPGAVLIDKRTTIDGDKVHTDKYYALPVKEVLKETTSTTRFIPAPPKYEGIGPTEDGIPIAPRNSVKKENMHNWYKTMYKSLHKADSSNDPQEYIIGYSSEPESNKKDKIMRKKSSTLDNRSSNNNDSKFNNNNFGYGYPPSAKSSIETYNVRPRLIEDYEPGHSSVTDDEITYGSKRYLPPMNVPKPSYEFKNGYEQDNHYTKKLVQPDPPSANQQKKWYNEIQHGGEVPQCGLGKPAPEKIQEPSIGPLPHPPLNYNGPTVPTQGTRPLTLPSEYAIVNENGLCQQQNGAYEIQMRQVIHSELHQRLSPSSSQLSSPTRSILKSPCRSPDLKIPARALFDFRPESPKEVSLKKGDNVLILRQLDKNWYEGEKQGIVGIFPISYIEVVPPEHASLPQSSFEGMGKVLYDFTAHTSIELSVKKHDMITLLRRVDSNWYEAKLQNRKGIVPASYLQVLQEPLEKRTPLSSPNSLISSSGSRPTSREGILKTVTPSSSQISPIHSTSAVVTNGRSNMQSRGKKSSNLIEPVMYRAIYSYSPQNTDELELAEGDTVYVVEMCDDGWYVGTSVRTGIFGIFPGNYVEKV